jgi:hypothetical protein
LAHGIPARLSKAEGRKFGLLVGGAFLVISAILWWRGRASAPYIAGLGGALVLAGLLVPTLLGPVNKAWMGLAHLLSKVTTPIFMGVVYFVIFTQIAVGMRLLGRRSLVHREHDGTYWIERDLAKPEPSRMKRQF